MTSPFEGMTFQTAIRRIRSAIKNILPWQYPGAKDSYTMGDFGVGVADPTEKFHVVKAGDLAGLFEYTSSDTTNKRNILAVQHTTSGDMDDEFGGAIAFYNEDDADTANLVGSIGARRNGADNTAYMEIAVPAAGVFERVAKFYPTSFSISQPLALTDDAPAYRDSTFTFNYVNITGQGKPTLVNVGAFYGFSLPVYNSDDEELFSCKCMPGDWDGTTDPIIYLGGWLDTANDTKKFNLQVSVETADYSGNDVVPATTNDYPVETTTGNWAQYTSFKVAFTIDASAIGLAVGQPITVRVRRLAATGDEIAGEVVIEGAVIVYVANKLGGATS